MANKETEQVWGKIKDQVVKGLSESFPIEGKTKSLHIQDVAVQDNKDSSDFKTQKRAILDGTSWTVPVKGTLVLKDQQGKVLSKSKRQIVSIPKITDRSTYIVGGNEYMINKQLRLKPGVYTHAGADEIVRSRFNTGKGANFNVLRHPITGIFNLEFGQASIPLYPVLKAAGASDQAISAAWGKEVFDLNHKAASPGSAKYENAIKTAYRKLNYLTRTDPVDIDSATQDMKNTLSKSTLDPEQTRLTLGSPYTKIAPNVLLDASSKIIKVENGNAKPDDRESIAHKEARGPEDYFNEVVTKGARGVRSNIKGKMNNIFKQDVNDISKLFPAGAMTSALNNNLNASGLVQYVSDSNPLHIHNGVDKITSFGEGSISSLNAVPNEVRNIHPSHVGFLDPIYTPEADKAGLDLHLTSSAKQDGKTLRGKFLDKNKKLVTKSLQNIKGLNIAFPGQIPSGGKVKVVRNGEVHTVPLSKVDLTLPNSQDMFSPTVNLTPFTSTNSGARVNYAAKMASQALSLVDREAPIVQSASDSTNTTSVEQKLGKDFSVTSPFKGKVVSVNKNSIKVETKQGTQNINLYNKYPIGGKNFISSEPLVKPGDDVRSGQTIADSNYTKNGVLSLGTNLNTVYIPFKGASVSGDTMVFWVDNAGQGNYTPIKDVPRNNNIMSNALDCANLKTTLHSMHSRIGHYTNEVMAEIETVEGIKQKATMSHSFVSINDSGDLYKIAPKDMIPGKTLLPVAQPCLPLSDTIETIILDSATMQEQSVTVPLNYDTGFLLGLYAASGRLLWENKTSPISIEFILDEEELKVKAESILRAMGLDTTCQTYIKCNGHQMDILTCRSNTLARFVEIQCRTRPDNLRVPPILWSSNTELINGFISGYWSGNGAVTTSITALVTSRELAEGLSFLLASIGVRATCCEHPGKYNTEKYLIRVFAGTVSSFPEITLTHKNDALTALQMQPTSDCRDYIPVPETDKREINRALGRRAVGIYNYTTRGVIIEALSRPLHTELSNRLIQLLYSKVWWDVVKSVNTADFEDYVYDLDMRPVGNFMVGPGLVVYNTFEDGIVVSEKAAKKLTSQHLLRFDMQISPTVDLNKNKYVAYFGNKLPAKGIGDLDNNGVVKVGAVLEYGDYIIAAMREDNATPEDALLGKISKKLLRPYRDISIIWEKDVPGTVTDVSTTKNSVTCTVEMRSPLVVGDKLTNRVGGKGVVTAVMPDAEMPKNSDGSAYDIVINPATIMSRMSIGQLYETAVSKTATEDKPYVAPQFSKADISRVVKDVMKKAGKKETDEVYGPDGEKLGDLYAGPQYFYKLGKTTDVNFSARAGQGSYDADMRPAKGGESGAKGLGMLEQYALISHNARNLIRESSAMKAEHNPDLWKAIQLGQPLPMPKPTFAFDKFQAYLKGSGVNVDKKGSRFKLMPMTDKDVLKMSNGEIENAKIVRASDLREEAGGLFDPKATGGKVGNRWSHINLAEPVVNPMFTKPARTLLDLKAEEFKDIQNLKGGQFIKDELGKINIKDSISKIRLKMSKNELKGIELDKSIKKLKYLESLDGLGMHPKDAYTLQKLPVIPPIFRPVYESHDRPGELRVSDANTLYKQSILVNEGLKQDVFKNLPDEEKKDLRRELNGAVAAVQGLDKPLTEDTSKGFVEILKGDTPKSGYFQSKVLAKRQDITGRGTIGGDPALSLDEVKIPDKMAWTLYGPFAIREMVKSGMTALEAREALETRSDRAQLAIDMAMEERPVLLNRAPTLHKFNVMGFKPKRYDGKTLLIPPMVMKGFNADTDGDCIRNSIYLRQKFNSDKILLDSNRPPVYDIGDNTNISNIITKETDMPFSKDTKIQYNYGVVNLEHFPHGKLIKTEGNKEVYEVDSKYEALTVKDGVKQWLPIESYSIHKDLQMMEVTTNTSRKICCSLDHSLVTVDDDLNYTKALPCENITVPRLREPLKDENLTLLSTVDIPESDSSASQYKFPDKFNLDYDLGYFHGVYIGDGWTNTNKEKLAAICLATDKNIPPRIIAIMSKYTDKPINVCAVDNHHEFEGKKSYSCKYTWNNDRVARYLKKHMPHGAINKALPSFWMQAPEEFRWGLLTGLIDTDGTVTSGKAKAKNTVQTNIVYATISSTLAYEIVALAGTLNLTASVVIDKRLTQAGNLSYTVSFTQESIKDMKDKLVLSTPSKKETLEAFVPNKDYKRNKYAPKLTAARLAELSKANAVLRLAIVNAYRDKSGNETSCTYKQAEKQVKTMPAMKKLLSIGSVISRCKKNNMPIPRQTALDIIDYELQLFTEQEFWAKWRRMVLDDTIEWELVTSVAPISQVTTAYDLTIPPAYTMVTESGIVVFDTMTVHVPVTEESRKEVLGKMMPTDNLFGILDSAPHYAPSNEAIMGLNIATKPLDGTKKLTPVATFQNQNDALASLATGQSKPHDIIKINQLADSKDCILNDIVVRRKVVDSDSHAQMESGVEKNKFWYHTINIKDFPKGELIKHEGNIKEYEATDKYEVLSILNNERIWKRPVSVSVHTGLKMLEATTSAGHTIHCSDDASLVTLGKDVGYVKVAPSRGLMIPRTAHLVNEHTPDIFSIGVMYRKSAYRLYLNKGLGYVTGVCIADGYLTQHSNPAITRPAVAFKNIKQSMYPRMRQMITDSRLNPDKTTSIQNNPATRLVNRLPVFIHEFFKQHILNRSRTCGTLPDFWMQSPEEYRWGIISAIWDVLGRVRLVSDTEDEFVQEFVGAVSFDSGTTAYSIVALLQTLGVTARVVVGTPVGKPPVYKVILCRNSVYLFKEHAMFYTDAMLNVEKLTYSRPDMPLDYAPPLDEERLKELIFHVSEKTTLYVDPSKKTEYAITNNIYAKLVKAHKNNKPILRSTALEIAQLQISAIDNSEFWQKWYEYVNDHNVAWDYIVSVEEIRNVTTAYDLTVPPAYTMVTETGCVVYDTTQSGGPHITTAGSLQLNSLLPKDVRDYNRVITKGSLKSLLKTVGTDHKQDYAKIAKGLKQLGDEWVTTTEGSLSFKDFNIKTKERDKLFADAERQVNLLPDNKNKEAETIKIYGKVQEKINDLITKDGKETNNNFFNWVDSGSRGNKAQLASITGAPVLVTDSTNKVILDPVKHNFIEGLPSDEYFTSLYGSRKGVTAAKLSVQEPGALAKELVASNIDMVVTMEDCGTTDGKQMLISDKDILDRYASSAVPGVVNRNDPITPRTLDAARKKGISMIKVRSAIYCVAPKGICRLCAGRQESGRMPDFGENLGAKFSMAMAEPLTQMALSTKHTAGVQSQDSGISRIKAVVEMPNTPQRLEVLSPGDGEVSDIVKNKTGGYTVSITDDNKETLEAFVPVTRKVTVSKGSSVQKGMALSDGIPNIAGYTALKGIIPGRKKMTDAIHELYKDGGTTVNAKIPELLSRSILNYVKVDDPGDHNISRGDIVEYSSTRHLEKPVNFTNPIGSSVGMKLGKTFGRYKPGSTITTDMVNEAKKKNLSTFEVVKNPIKTSPVAIGINRLPVVKTDWIGKMGFRYLKNTLQEGAAYGAESNIHSLNPIPALAYGAEFGQAKNPDGRTDLIVY